MKDAVAGPGAMLAGLRLIFTPGLKRFVLVPLLSNIVLLFQFYLVWL